MEVRQLGPGAGWRWIVQGFNLFRKSPLLWIVLCLILLAIAVVVGMIPWLGQLVLYLLSPVFLAGVMVGCRAVQRGKELEISHLFEGFRRNTSALVTIGGVYLVGQILIYGVMQMVGGHTLDDFVRALQEAGSGGTMPEMAQPVKMAMLVGAALSVPLLMAVWFAPLLVIFDGFLPFRSMRTSFNACLANMLPLLVYGLVLVVLILIALIPLALGMLILVPVVFTSLYASYEDIFVSEQGIVNGE